MDKESEKGIGIDPDSIGVDISGYSEKQTDLAIDTKISGGQTIKQFHRGTKLVKQTKKENILFEKNKGA